MARYDKHQDLEFEFIINSDISIVSEIGKKSLKIDYNTNIIAYQNWSIKTKSLNNEERAVFNYTCDKLIEAAARLENMSKSYEPSVIMSYKNSNDESIHLVFSANNLRVVEDKRDSNLYMFMDVTDKLHSDFIPEAGNYQNVRLNLSTMPYHVMGVNMSLLPPSNNNEEVHTSNHHFEKPPFSFLLNTTVSSISTVNGVSQIRVPSNTLLYAYEQWSVNHDPLEDRDRILKTLTWQQAKENVEEYNSKFQNSAFTPTVFIEINEKQYLGVITNLEIEDSHAVLSVETKSMAMKQNGQSSPLPSLPESLVEGTKIFMNIDDTPSVKNIEPRFYLDHIWGSNTAPADPVGGRQDIQHNEILTIDSSNFKQLGIETNIYNNYGKFNIIIEKSDLIIPEDLDPRGYWASSGGTPPPAVSFVKNIYSPIINYGEICIFIRDSEPNIYFDVNFNTDYVRAILSARAIYNMDTGNINISGLIPHSRLGTNGPYDYHSGDNDVLDGSDMNGVAAKYRTYRRRINITGGECAGPVCGKGGPSSAADYHDFTFLDTVIDNLGSIYFNPIINNSYRQVVGINSVRTCGLARKDRILNGRPGPGYTEEFTDDLPAYPRLPYVTKGTIYFDLLQSSANFDILNDSTTERSYENMTIGILNLTSLSYGNIAFGALRSGLFDASNEKIVCRTNGVRTVQEEALLVGGHQDGGDLCQISDSTVRGSEADPAGRLNGLIISSPDERAKNRGSFNLKQSVIGIFNAGDIDDITSTRDLDMLDVDIARIDYRLTNPNYDFYGLSHVPGHGPGETPGSVPEPKKTSSHICGVGDRGKIIIGAIQNASIITNPNEDFDNSNPSNFSYPVRFNQIPNACGVYRLIQVDETANTFINEVVNWGYGGKSACMGICNLLVNYGQVQIYAVNNLLADIYPETDNGESTGIFRVIQNGYTEILDNNNLSNKERASLQRACLPPFPPAYYDTNGEPNKIESPDINKKVINQIFTNYGKSHSMSRLISYWFDVSENLDDFYGGGIPLNMKYKQGHISIDRVITNSRMNCNSVGINEYGGWAFQPEMPKHLDWQTPISIEVPMKDYVKKNAPLSVIWSYPTAQNTQWDPSGYSQLLKEVFPPDNQGNYLTPIELTEAVKKKGWWWFWDNPVQMYYKYVEDTNVNGLLTDIINFPINWGIVTINHVLSGNGSNSRILSDSEVKGSAMGIKKLVTAMGPVQIINIESNIELESQPEFGEKKIELEEFTKINTEESPELTKEFFNDDSTRYIDFSIKYVHGYNVTQANGASLDTLPIMLSINSADIADPENRFDGVWTTGTQVYNNYCWPYNLVSKADLADEISGLPEPAHLRTSAKTLEQEFDLLGFTPPSGSSATNLLEFLMSPGAAFGVFRTVDYGSESPGLSFLKSWTTPIETRPYLGDVWNNAQECYGSVKVWESIYTDCLFDSCFNNPTPDSIRLNVKEIEVTTPAIYKNKLTPIKSSLLEKTEKLHYDIVRSRVSGRMSDGSTVESGWTSDYLRYPLRPRASFNFYDIGNTSRLSHSTANTFEKKRVYGNSPGNHPFGIILSWQGDHVMPPIYPLSGWSMTASTTMNPLISWLLNFGAPTDGGDLGSIGVRRAQSSIDGNGFKAPTVDPWLNIYKLNKDYIVPTNPWIGVWLTVHDPVTGTKIERILDQADSTKQFADLVEKPVKMNTITDFHGVDMELKDSDFIFDNIYGSYSVYIYNNEVLNSLIDSGKWDDINSSQTGNKVTLPVRDNYFNGLTPFPVKLINSTLETAYQNLTFSNRTFQDYIPLSEKIIWNPSAYHITNPHAYIDPGTGDRPGRVSFIADTNRYIIQPSAGGTGGGDKVRAETHDSFLKAIYPFLKKDETYGFYSFPEEVLNGTASMPSHFNILHSKWPYDEALKQLNNKYFSEDKFNLYGAGRSGPNHSTYYSPSDNRVIKMRNHPYSSLANFLSYNYSSTKPVGFNPQLIRGGYWNLDSKHKNINSIMQKGNAYYGAGDMNNLNKLPSFSVISKGKKYIDPLFDLKWPNFVSDKRKTHDDNYIYDKYLTHNRYYGFVYENRNPLAKMKYKIFDIIEGPYNRYNNILKFVTDQIYIEGEQEEAYTSQIKGLNTTDEFIRLRQEQKEREDRQTEGLWSLGENAVMMAALMFLL